jgi:hypothetical protein
VMVSVAVTIVSVHHHHSLEKREHDNSLPRSPRFLGREFRFELLSVARWHADLPKCLLRLDSVSGPEDNRPCMFAATQWGAIRPFALGSNQRSHDSRSSNRRIRHRCGRSSLAPSSSCLAAKSGLPRSLSIPEPTRPRYPLRKSPSLCSARRNPLSGLSQDCHSIEKNDVGPMH